MRDGPVESWPGRYPTTRHPTSLTCILHTPLPTQVPEDFGPVRTVAEGRGDTLYVGTTRNSILLGSVHTGFSLLVQVSTAPLPQPPVLIPPLNVPLSPHCHHHHQCHPCYHVSISFSSCLHPCPIPFFLAWETPHPFLGLFLLTSDLPSCPWPELPERVTAY